MIIKVKEFIITPMMCPIKRTDCSPCRHAIKMKVNNPRAMGTAPANFGEVDCNYFIWFKGEYKRKCKEIL